MADGTLKVGTITNSAGSGNITIGSGVTLLSNVPAFEAYLSANQGISDATYTKVQFNTEVFDTDNCYDNSTNYRFTPTVAGKYYVYTKVQCDSQAASNLSQVLLKLYKNGSDASLSQIKMNSNNPESMIVSLFTAIDMNGSSDYLEIFANIDDTSSTPTIRGTSYPWTCFGAYRLGA